MTNMRDGFLSECCRKKIGVKLFTTNGFQVKGTILFFDGAAVIVSQDNGEQAMVYHTAISTIIPAQPVITRYETIDTRIP